jgi:phospholipid-binding lipoprotein MlaA
MLKSVTGRNSSRFLFAALAMGVLAACATPPGNPDARAEYDEANDPFETTNRLVFSANVMVDQLVLQPAAVTYRDIVPTAVKPAFENLITNLFQPISFIHAVLQGDMDRAGDAAARFLTAIPTLLLGNMQPDKEPVFEDAGQTLAVWGFEEGPYVMLPLLGPSSVRDSVGTVANFFADPVGWVLGTKGTLGRAAGNAVVVRSQNIDQVRDLQANSLDYYAAVRSLYRQQRAAQISNGESELFQPAPTIGLDPDDLPGNEPNKETASGK